MTTFMPSHAEADIDVASRNKMLSELLIEEFPNTEGMSTAAAEDYLRSKVVDKFNINHPEYTAHVSYDCTARGDFITAWVTRKLALIKLKVTSEEPKCSKTQNSKMMALGHSLRKFLVGT